MNKSRIAIVAVAVALGAVAVWILRPDAPAAAGGPVVIFSIDTLRADRLPAYGYTKIQTPNIDRFVADGVLFEHAYSHSPQTLPAHASLLTGRLPFEHGVRDNIGFTLPASARMLQQDLRERGYATAGIVSAYVLRKETGVAAGFDFFDDQLPPAAADRAIGQVQRDGMESLKAAGRWLDARRSDRLFLFFHLYEPHKPYAPPARYASMDPYDGEVSYSDEIVGALLNALRARDLYDEATIIVFSDHGEGLGDHVEQEHGLFVYDETIRVPLIVRLPRGARGGRRVAAPVQHIDLRPTLLELTGAPARGARGRSLRALLDESGTIAPQGIYSEALYPRYHFGWSELLALTDDRYRYIRAPREELYDLERDPREQRNIAPERPQVAVAMRAALNALTAGTPLQQPGAVSAEDRQRLQALGYIGSQAVVDETPGERLPDPKDKARILEEYRRAVELAGRMELTASADALKALVREDPNMTDVWAQYAQVLSMLGDTAGALDAYKQVLKRNPAETGALLAAGSALLQLHRYDEATAHAELAAKDGAAAAHQLLARIAVARKDASDALREAALAEQADPTLPMRDYVEGLLHYNEGRYAEALPPLQRAAEREQQRTLQLNELHYYIADSLARLERYAEAEPHFRQEIAVYRFNVRARAGLAMLYRAMGRDAESEAVIAEMLRLTPTPESFRVAGDLWTMFGEREKGEQVRAAARRRFGAAAR